MKRKTEIKLTYEEFKRNSPYIRAMINGVMGRIAIVKWDNENYPLSWFMIHGRGVIREDRFSAKELYQKYVNDEIFWWVDEK